MEVTIGNASFRNEAWDEAKQGRKYAFFREATVLNKAKTEAQGRPIHDPVVLLEKIIPGDNLNRPVRPMREEDKQEYPQEWAAFQAKREQQIPGTPLAVVPWLSRTQIAEYNALGIYTVEQLATLPESVAHRIMGFHEIRRKAENFLKAAQNSAHQEELEARAKRDEEEKATLRADKAALEARITALEAALQPATPRKGRPRKVA